MGVNTEAFQEARNKFRKKSTGFIVFTPEEKNQDATITFSTKKRKAPRGAFQGNVQVFNDIVYIAGRVWTQSRVKDLGMAFKAAGVRNYLFANADTAAANGHTVNLTDPEDLPDDDSDSDSDGEDGERGSLPPAAAGGDDADVGGDRLIADDERDEGGDLLVADEDLPDTGDAAARGGPPARPASNDDDDDDDASTHGEEKPTDAEKQDPNLAAIAKRIGLLLPKWADLRDRLLASGPAPDVARKIEALDRILGVRPKRFEDIITRLGDKALATLERVLPVLMELFALAKAVSASAATAAAPAASEYGKVSPEEAAEMAKADAAGHYGDASDVRGGQRDQYGDASDVRGGQRDQYGDASDVRDQYADTSEVRAGQPAAYVEMLANWQKLFNAMASIPSNDKVQTDIATVESIIRPGSSFLTLDQIMQTHGPDGPAKVALALQLYERLSNWQKANPMPSGEEVAAERAVGQRIRKYLPMWPKLQEQLVATEPDAATMNNIDRLDRILRNGGSRVLSLAQIIAVHGPRATAVMEEAENLFLKLARIARDAAESLKGTAAASSAASSSGADAEYADLVETPDPEAEAALRARAQQLQTYWDTRVAPLLNPLAATGTATPDSIKAAVAEFRASLQRGDRASLEKAGKIAQAMVKLGETMQRKAAATP